MVARRVPQQILLVCALAAGIAACSSSGNSSGSGASSSPSSAPSSSAPATSARPVSLLQDGQTFESVIKSQAGSGLAASATSKVTKVTVVSPTQAKVTYSIL